VTLLDLSDDPADLACLSHFYEQLYIAGFPDADERESLANMTRYLTLRRQGWYGDNSYHILVAVEEGRVIAASVSDYLAVPNCGVIEFVLVDEGLRGRGLGKMIHDATLEVLNADARRTGRSGVDALAIELNDPFQVPPGEDNYDPFRRALIWDSWGYGQLCFPYVQPALSATQEPVTCLLFAARPIAAPLRDGFPAALVLDILEGYLRWAMRIDEPDRNPQFADMKKFLRARGRIDIESLAVYVGRDPGRPLCVVPVTAAGGASYRDVTEVYRRAFPPGPTAIDTAIFAEALAWPAQRPGLHYHLWGLAVDADSPIAGMASFFVMPRCGFAGYLALEAPLRGTGRAHVALKRMEEQMIRDEPGARHWYAECVPGSAAEQIARRVGFEALPVLYYQPDLQRVAEAGGGAAAGPPLTLLRKKLGTVYGAAPFDPEDFLQDLQAMLREVYRMAEPTRSETYRRAHASLASRSAAAN